MASVDESQGALQIAGRGHVYIAEPDTLVPDLGGYQFADGTTLEGSGWYWLGDTSAENVVSFESDGGETNNLHTWDRENVDATREATTSTVTINSVALTATTVELAFYGSTFDARTGGYDLNLGGTVEKAALIVIEDAGGVSAILIRRATFGGTMPTLDRENFTEVPITGTILTPVSGRASVHWIPRRSRSGLSSAAPAITDVSPATAAAGAAVVLTGTGFTGTYAVTFNGRFGSFTVVSDTEIRVNLPTSLASGEAEITVRNGAGSDTGTVTVA